MTIDVSQFVHTFLEESFEGLDAMEAQLLELQDDDPESIDAIFRAAHSIKGGAGTFGFSAVSTFTHGVETLLDQMRSGSRPVSPELTTLLLNAVDTIREMLAATRDGNDIDAQKISTVSQDIDSYLAESPESTDNNPSESSVSSETEQNAQGWRIRFVPSPEIMMTGNDPVRILNAIAELGEMHCHCDTRELPPLADLDPESCFLSWDIELVGSIKREDIEELFEWIEDQCELLIEPLEDCQEEQSTSNTQDEAPFVTDSTETAPLAESTAPMARKPQNDTGTGSIRVNTNKVDALIDMVGELVITQSMLGELGERLQAGDASCTEQLLDGIATLERNTRELQENVMGIRMMPISFAFNRFPRMVHDLAKTLDKSLELKLSGEQTELDKNVLEKISDPLVHLVRNAADHGIEAPAERRAAGKPETGTIYLNAYHKGGNIIIEIKDDGAGLNRERIRERAVNRGLINEDTTLSDEQVYDLVFAPGFSTAEAVSDVSGRGVGMDVVRRNIKSLGGAVEINSQPGHGSAITIRLPLTLSILDGQLIEVGSEKFVIPLISIIESIQVSPGNLRSVADNRLLYRLREQYIPIVFLDHLLQGTCTARSSMDNTLLVVVEADGQQAGLVVDDLLGQQQVVIKALETNFRRVDGISGATILGDGTVALILDASGLMDLAARTPLPKLFTDDLKDANKNDYAAA